YVKATSDATGTTSASYYVRDPSGGLVETSLTAVAEGFPALANGYYVVTAKNAEPKEKEWATTVVYMDKVDKAKPVVTLAKDSTTVQAQGEVALTWSAQKEDKTSAATILEASINGFNLTFDKGKTWVGGSFPVTHAGDYTLKAKDTAGNSSAEANFTLTDVPVRKPSGALFTVENALGGNGKVTVDINGVVGGKYVPESTPASNSYKGSYEWKLLLNPPKPPKPPKQPELPEGIKLADVLNNDSDWLTDKTKTIDNLAPGEYTLYVRDATDATEKHNEATVLVAPVVVGDEAITLTFEEKTVNEIRSLNWTANKGAHA
ncbi:MAG: hypothetical protein RR336_10905, partial [Oscillospiraceae bacterium]